MYLVGHLIDSSAITPFFRSIARYYNRTRFPVMIGSVAPAGSLQRAIGEFGVRTYALDAVARWQYPVALYRLVRLLKRNKVAILHAHCFDPTVIGLLGAGLGRVRFVFTRHHSDHNIRLGKQWHTRIDAWCARHADQVIAVSEATRRIMVEVERVPTDRITVVYNGLEPVREPLPERVRHVQEELDVREARVCLMVARLHEEKGHRFLFDAIPDVISRVGPVAVLLAGDGPHRAQLEAEVRARRLNGVVRFLGWRDDIPELMSLASVVILPSLAESFGVSVVEAMSLGKPVVASTTGGIPEVVVDGETGVLVPPADSQALAEAVSRVLQDPEWAGQLGRAGQERSALFGAARMVREYEMVYDRLTGRTESGRPPMSPLAPGNAPNLRIGPR